MQQPSAGAKSVVSKKTRRDYKYIRGIGQGAFGEANLVRNAEGKLRVMKTIDFSKLDREQQKDAVNEVRIMSALRHPYIVAFYESFEENEKLAIIMDFAEGGDLAGRITRQASKNSLFSEGQLIRWATQILLGMKHLSQKRIIHRDLKPCNIFLTKEGDPRLGDFGLSKVLDDSYEFKDECYTGTPSYFSPEVFAERLYSSASDVWALGCVLHELGTFRVPFEAPDFKTLCKKVSRDPAPVLPRAFTEEMRQICRDLLYWDYKKRPTISELTRRPMIRLEVRNLILRSREDSPSAGEQSAAGEHISTTDDFEAKPIVHVPKRHSASIAGCPSVLSKAGSKALISSAGCLTADFEFNEQRNHNKAHNAPSKAGPKVLISSAGCLKVDFEFNEQRKHAKANNVISPIRQKSCTPVFSRCGVGCGPRVNRCRSSAFLVLQG